MEKKEMVIKKSEVARIAQTLVLAKLTEQYGGTPMRATVDAITDRGRSPQTEITREKYIRVARYLGWQVCKRGGKVYENGIEIWTIAGN